MQINEDLSNTRYRIMAMDDSSITINNTRHQNSVIIMPNQLISDWPVTSINQLSIEHIAVIANLHPDVVIIGTGKIGHRLSMQQLEPLHQKQIGVESMDTRAAVRTYAALSAEGRHVAGALIIETSRND